ncbi:hypothetical protein [Kineothrix sedimenti]|uniref:Uncharacterized protein n=1 Tax=Kineothrix sedimenti TaxID=3123317 RepID=A0ABZ3F056_9FIRM
MIRKSTLYGCLEENKGKDGDSVKIKIFTRKFVPAAQSLQVLERHGY